MPGPPAISARRAAKLNTKKHREAERLFLAEGSALIGEAPAPPVQVFDEREQVRRISTLKTPTGPVGVFPFLDVPAGQLLSTSGRIVLLHGVQDPGNVGTVIRSAHAFGAGVALSRGCADLYNPKTVRATMGSIFHAPVARELDTRGFSGAGRGERFRVGGGGAGWRGCAAFVAFGAARDLRRCRRGGATERGRRVVRGEGHDSFAGGLVKRGDRGLDPALRGLFACATISAHYGGKRAHRRVEVRGTLRRRLLRFHRDPGRREGPLPGPLG